MSKDAAGGEAFGVLRSKRDATRYRILVQIAERQPAVSQQEVADGIGVTPQAVSDYLQDLVQQGFVEKHGRGRYEVTNEGVDWLISQTDALRDYVAHVSEDVIGEVDNETAIASSDIVEGQTVSLSMQDGVLHATPDTEGGATAVAVTDAAAGRDVGVTNFEGVVDLEVGTVTIVSIPSVEDGGSSTADPDDVVAMTDEHDIVATAGIEALAAARAAAVEPDVRFGTAGAVQEAAVRGLDVLLLATNTELGNHTAALRDSNVGYELFELDEE